MDQTPPQTKNELSCKKRKTAVKPGLGTTVCLSNAQNDKFISDLANELDLQTAPFEHVFISHKKTLNEPMKEELISVNSSINYRFYSKIPKPEANYCIRYGKYTDFPTRIPKYKVA